jgi:ribosomal protein S18 acetylase RimI-like enzyme
MPESQTVTVRRLLPQDWQVYRAIRLAMLKESPWAFGATLAEAASFDPQLWRQRLAGNAVFLARMAELPAGSATYSDHRISVPGDCGLFGMWVDPGFRKGGVGRALVEAVVAQARAAGKRRVVLHAVSGNLPAVALYERAGFVPIGDTVPYRRDDQVVQIEMELVLEAGHAHQVTPVSSG